MRSMRRLIESVRETVQDYGMIERGDHVLAAVSGGLDSLTLLYVLNALRGEMGFALAVGHVDHGTRAGRSAQDARYVTGLAEELGLPSWTVKADVAGERRRAKTSFQEAARNVRYRLLADMLAEWGGEGKIAVAHTADDQVETVLMNFMRGAGCLGLGGIPPVRGDIIRPLCRCFRAELEAAGLPWSVRDDETNRRPDYLRNRIRLKLIPYLEKNYNTGIKRRILENAGHLRDDEEFLEASAEVFWREARALSDNGALCLSAERVASLPPAMRRRLVRRAVREAKGDTRALSARHVEEVLDLLRRGATGKELHLPGGVVARRTARDRLVFKLEKIPRRGHRILCGNGKKEGW